MNLYYIAATDDNDINMSLDLFVTASTPSRALRIWEQWSSGFGRCHKPEIFLVPQPASKEQAHMWHSAAPLGVQKV